MRVGDEALIAEAKALWLDGTAPLDIAATLSVQIETVLYWAKRAGWARMRPILPTPDIEAAFYAARASGLSVAKACEVIGVPESTGRNISEKRMRTLDEHPLRRCEGCHARVRGDTCPYCQQAWIRDNRAA